MTMAMGTPIGMSVVTMSMVMVTAVTIAIMGAMAMISTMVGTLMMMGMRVIVVRTYTKMKFIHNHLSHRCK